MASNYVQPGDVLEFEAPVGGVVSGTCYVIGSFFVVATVDADAGDMFRGQITGCWRLPKTAGQSYTAGDPLYWDEAPGQLTNQTAAGPMIGAASEDAATADDTAAVRLNGIALEGIGTS